MGATTADSISHAVGTQPLLLVQAPEGEGLAAAKWRFEGNRPFGAVYPDSILAFRVAGSASVTRVCDGHTVRKRPRIGSVTFVHGDRGARWTVDDAVESVHLYLPQTRIAAYLAEFAGPGVVRIDDFFAIEDAWLHGFFHMLLSELDVNDTLGQRGDTLLLEQTEHLILRHLVRWHSDAGSHAQNGLERQSRVSPLRTAHLRRIEDYVCANLTREITLTDLAGLCALSIDHFLRSFRTATGVTPHRYVLEQRLRRAATLLRTTDAPIARVAATCGFRNASNFSVKFQARFAASPTAYRRQA